MRFLIFLIVLSVAGWFWHSRSEKRNTLAALQVELKTIESSIKDRQNRIASLQKQLEPLRQGQAELSKPNGSPEQLEKEVLELRDALTSGNARLDSAEADYFTAVTELREFSKTKEFPVLKLPSGEELKQCRITKFGEGYVSVSHADGIVKLAAEDLPEGWVDKFAVNYVSRESKEETAALSQKVQDAVLPPLDLKRAKLSEVDERLKEVNASLLALSSGIRAATRQADKMERDAFRITPGGESRGPSTAERRDAMFKKAKEILAARELVRQKYVDLRNQKAALERQRLAIKNAKPAAQDAPPP